MDASIDATPDERQPPIRRVLYPIRAFMHARPRGGIVLIACALAALLWANSPWGGAYAALWATKVTIGPLSETLLHWINDGLMAVFFFVVGLEIKRRGPRRRVGNAAPGGVADRGGAGRDGRSGATVHRDQSGWPRSGGLGHPDGDRHRLRPLRAGTTGAAGTRGPADLPNRPGHRRRSRGGAGDRALSTTAQVSWIALGAAAGALALLIAANRLGVRHPLAYAALGVGLWVAFLALGRSRHHRGEVLLALTIPARTRVDTGAFLRGASAALKEFDRADAAGVHILTDARQQAALAELEELAEGVQTPLQRLEHMLHPWVAFAIVPLFALANAGVALGGGLGCGATGTGDARCHRRARPRQTGGGVRGGLAGGAGGVGGSAGGVDLAAHLRRWLAGGDRLHNVTFRWGARLRARERFWTRPRSASSPASLLAGTIGWALPPNAPDAARWIEGLGDPAHLPRRRAASGGGARRAGDTGISADTPPDHAPHGTSECLRCGRFAGVWFTCLDRYPPARSHRHARTRLRSVCLSVSWTTIPGGPRWWRCG